MKSWGSTATTFPNSLREIGKGVLFFPPFVKAGAGGVGRLTVECTTGPKRGAIDGFDCVCAASPLRAACDGFQTATRRSFLATLAVVIAPAASVQDNALGRDKSSLRLETMRRLAKEMKVYENTDSKPGPPLLLRPEPLLRYNNAANNLVDGTLWCWADRGRPAAVLKLGLRGPKRGQRSWNLNVAALSPKPIEVEFGNGPGWSSRPPGELQPRTVPDAPAPAGAPAQRLTQARAIARRFSVNLEARKPGRIQQRLLPQPLDRYGDPEAGLLDGMLFAFVGATNPNVLLILEAWSAGAGKGAWRYAFARLSNVEETALLDGKQVWNVPLISTPANAELYMGRSTPADAAVQD